jgi:hypothetical protein
MKKKKPKKIYCPRTEYVDGLNVMDTIKLLKDLMEKLDELDMDDFFGTEGWRKRLGYED